MEEAEADFEAELAAVFVPFDEEAEEEADVSPNWKLPRIPDALVKEIDAFSLHRTDPLVRAREGTACVDITVRPPVALSRGFLDFRRTIDVYTEKQVSPRMGIFCRSNVSGYVEEWLRALREKGNHFSTLANYANCDGWLVRLKWGGAESAGILPPRCVCPAPNLGAVPRQRAFSHLKGGFPRHRAAALFREAWDVTRPRRVEKH
eukprot:4576059-Prymnesium_polylepis.1